MIFIKCRDVWNVTLRIQCIIEIAKQFNIDAQVIGHVEKYDNGKKLTIDSTIGTFEY